MTKELVRSEYIAYELARQDGWSEEQLHQIFDFYEDDERIVYPGLGIVLKNRRIIWYKDTLWLNLRDVGVPAVAYCDGSGTTANKVAGCGVVIYRPNYEPIYLAKNIGNATNNVAEISAVAHALRYFNHLDQSLLILTDSQYTINMLAEGFNATANKELIDLVRQDLALRPNVEFQHVYGHEGEEGNEAANVMANLGRKYVKKVSKIL